MLQQWAGEDTEIVFEKLRKLQSIEKVYRSKTSTNRIHDVPRSYGKFTGLARNGLASFIALSDPKCVASKFMRSIDERVFVMSDVAPG